MRIVADFHIHSRFSRACSKELALPSIAQACAVRGIDLVVTGDFTHPAWRKEMGEHLIEHAEGVFVLKNGARTQFLLGTELSCIAKHAGRTRRVHNLVLAPSLVAVDRLSDALRARGCNLTADGRPILGLTSKALLECCLTADERMLVIPAHAWTPWFAVFGSESGYDSLAECFEDLTPHILAIETGLSSDPPMNWRCSMLDTVALISSSDAHSLKKLGREATVLELEALTFASVTAALRASAPNRYTTGAPNRIVTTTEFFPEEGKYHFDGHRLCGVRCAPEETLRRRAVCPQCAKLLTIGVMHRVDKLADRPIGFTPPDAPAFRSIVPLIEVLMEACGAHSVTRSVHEWYSRLTNALGSEFAILLDVPIDRIARVAPPEITEAIRRVRSHELDIAPGYDGEFGTIRIFSDARPRPVARQHQLFAE